MGLRLSFGVGPLRASIPLTSRRRRRGRQCSSSAPRGWQGTGEAFTPDERHVRFQCGHHHRSQPAALECVAKRRAQIERGNNLHLVTRVLDTPESRQRDAERAEQKAARDRERAAARQEAARQRAERREAARQARTERTVAARQERAEQWELGRQARMEQTDARREAARKLAAERRARRAARPPLSWPGWGNISAGAAFIAGIVLAGAAGSNAHSPLAVVAALLVVVSTGVAAVCMPVALWRKFQVRKRARGPSS